MGRNINSKSQINVKKPHFIKKTKCLKDRSQKHKEKIEASEKVKPVPKTDNLYVSDKKNFKLIVPNNRVPLWGWHNGKYQPLDRMWSFRDGKWKYYGYIPSDHEKIKEKFKHGKPRNIHKRGSAYKIKKLRKKHIREKPDRKRLKNQCKIATPYGECCICLESKEMSKTNTIKCGNVSHVLCAGCKDKIKDNKCPLCRSHPIDPDKEEMVIRNDILSFENIITRNIIDNTNDNLYITTITSDEYIRPRRRNLFETQFQYM